jgi:hypothetical protein
MAARFIVPYKHGFDKSNRYNKHTQNVGAIHELPLHLIKQHNRKYLLCAY